MIGTQPILILRSSLLERPQPALSLAVYAHVASQSSVGARQDRSELCWMTFAEPSESVSVTAIFAVLPILLLSGYQQVSNALLACKDGRWHPCLLL